MNCILECNFLRGMPVPEDEPKKPLLVRLFGPEMNWPRIHVHNLHYYRFVHTLKLLAPSPFSGKYCANSK